MSPLVGGKVSRSCSTAPAGAWPPHTDGKSLLPECNHLLPSQHSAAFICILRSSLALCGIPFCITSHSIKSGNIFQAQMRQNADPASYRINTTFDTSHWLAFTRIFLHVSRRHSITLLDVNIHLDLYCIQQHFVWVHPI